MRQLLIFLTICVLSFDISAQEIPKNPNAYDLDDNKTGVWTILYDLDWNVTESIDNAKFYRVITYDEGIPSGKVVDYYFNGAKQWEGYLLSDDPEEIMDGKCIWFNDDSLIIEIKHYKNGSLSGVNSYYNDLGKLCIDLVYNNNSLVDYQLYSPQDPFLINTLLEDILLYDNYNLRPAQIAVEIVEKIYGKENTEYIFYSQKLAKTYFNLGDYNMFHKLNLEQFKLLENLFDSQGYEDAYASVLGHLAESYSLLGNYNKALELNLKCLDLNGKIYGRKDLRYINSLSNLGGIYLKLGKHNKCLEIDLEVLDLQEEISGKHHPDYAFALHNLALSYSKLGNYKRSMELNSKALLIREETIGKENIYYLTTLNNLAQSYHKMGEYHKSIEIHMECLERRKKLLGKKHPDYIQSLNNLSLMYIDLGDYNMALNFLLEGHELKVNIFGKKHPTYITSINNLSIAYSNLEKYDKSLKLDLERLSITEKIFGKENPSYANALINLAGSYANLGNYKKSLELNSEALLIREKEIGKKHPDYATSLAHLAGNYSNLGDYSKSLDLRLECLLIRKQLFGENHPDYALALDKLSFAYINLNKYNKAYVSLNKSININFSLFNLIEKNLNTNLINKMYNNLFSQYNQLFNLSVLINSSELKKNQYDNLCLLKGRELTRYSTMISDIYASNDNKLISLYQDWREVNKTLSFCYENTLDKTEKIEFNTNKIKDESDKLERQLKKRSSTLGLSMREYSFDDITSNLKDDDVYFDIVNISTYNSVKGLFETDSNRYYAYVIKKGYTSPQLVYLGSHSDFDGAYNYYSNYTQERPSNKEFSNGNIVLGNVCYQKFWSKLEPYLEGVSNVYFSSEGVYSKINPNILYDSTSSSFLMDKYDIVHVSNVEDFVHQKENIKLYERPDNLNAVLIGNPTFLLEKDEVVLASNETQSRSINQDELDRLQRGMLLSDLPGTQTEVDLISDNLKSKNWDVEVITGIDATETRVKSIEAPKILHIATHGFFFEDLEMVKRSNMISTDNKKAIANPMTRSGLIFSGAENTMNGEILAGDNGWLNSSEVSLLNLRGTELVVLSACKTGTGDVQNGKGVYGLQRAIRVAGAETLIMSMWEVDDKATQELMTYFYDYWIDKKMTKKDAFNKAQQKIREKYKHPYYWGAFIMLGE